MATTSKRNHVITISPLQNSCTSCATNFYQFALSDQTLLTDVSLLFCELLGIDVASMSKQMQLSQIDLLQLPFCPNCLLELNELRQINTQLQKLDKTATKLKDSLLSATITRITNRVGSNCLTNDNDQING